MDRSQAEWSVRPQPRISVIVPALNESATIDATLEYLIALQGVSEVIVVDGGSRDDTVVRAARHGIRLLACGSGRGRQMHAGAMAATGDVLWFVHADTTPAADAPYAIAAALLDPRVGGGNCEIRFSGDFLSARFLTWLYHHLAILGLRYGDSGYFVRRTEYLAVGGFRPYPIFEDLDLMRRLRRRGRFVRVPAVVTTSSRRFEGRWFALVFARWTLLQIFYWIGVSPNWIGRFYRHVRLPGRRGRRRFGAGAASVAG